MEVVLMLKLTKYEFIKSKTTLIIIGLLFSIFEGYFIYGILTKNDEHTAISILMLTFFSLVCYFIVFVMAINNYSKELSSKSSYLIFMTPNSSLNIILSKILSTLIIGTVIVAVIGILAFIDISVMFDKYSSLNNWKDFFKNILDSMGVNTVMLIPTILGYIANFLISFFCVVTEIYFAITLSSTLLQNNKFKGFLSFTLVVLFTYLIIKVEGYFPIIYDNPTNSAEIVINLIPNTVFELCIMIASTIGCAKLLEKKVSL